MSAAIPATRPSAGEKQVPLGFSMETLRRGALVGAAALIGFALIMWIAANWDTVGKSGRFAIVAVALAAGALGAMLRPVLSTPGLLIAFLATGGMLALIGQTYQTGADTWQLFAAWAALGLPFALAARSDAVWSPWVGVSMTALTLWQSVSELAPSFLTMSSGGVARASLFFSLLASLLPALAVCALLSPGSIAGPWIGSRRWAFRLAMLLTMFNAATWGFIGVLGLGRLQPEFALLALVILAGLGGWLVYRRQNDPLLISAAALGIDVVLIAGITRAITPSFSSSSALPYFTIGIAAALIIAASVVVVLKLLTAAPQVTAAPSTQSPDAPAQNRPWPVIALSALGALLAAVPLIAAIAILLGSLLMTKGPATYVIGGAILAAGIAMLLHARSLFLEQLATIVFALGLALLVYVVFRDLPDWVAGFVLGLGALGLAVTIGKPWLAGLLGAIATCGIAIGLVHFPGLPGPVGVRSYLVTWGILAAAWALAIHWVDNNRQWLEPMPSTRTLDALATGAVVAILLALSVGGGPTFMLDGMLGISTSRVHAVTPGAFVWFTPQRALAVALSAATGFVFYRAYPETRSPLGVGIAVAALALALYMPTLAPVALVLAVAMTSGRRGIALLSGVAIVWIIGNFYYALALTLTEKAAILAIVGAGIGAWALASRTEASGSLLPGLAAMPAHVPLYARALAAAGLILAGGISAQAINEKETLIRDGAPVFVELVPVDPRSLMQGDYMALRFRLPDGAARHRPTSMARPSAIGTRDAAGVVTFNRIGTASDAIGGDEIRVELTRGNRGWTVVTNAWFFKEGTAKKWEAARFGEFRVVPDGRALLVGLADKDRVAIK